LMSMIMWELVVYKKARQTHFQLFIGLVELGE